MAEFKELIDDANKKEENLGHLIEQAEGELGIKQDKNAPSDKLKASLVKIESLARNGISHPRLVVQYNAILDKYKDIQLGDLKSKEEFDKRTSELLKEIDSLTLDDGTPLKDYIIDGGFYEMVVAVAEGLDACRDKIIKDFKDTLQLIVSPEEREQIAEALGTALMHPVQFANMLMELIKTELTGLYNKLLIINRESTDRGNIIEMSYFVPEKVLPLILTSVGPLKGGLVNILKKVGTKAHIVEKLEKNIHLLDKEIRELYPHLKDFSLSKEGLDFYNRIRDVKGYKGLDLFQNQLKVFEIIGDERGITQAIGELRANSKVIKPGYTTGNLADELESYMTKYKKDNPHLQTQSNTPETKPEVIAKSETVDSSVLKRKQLVAEVEVDYNSRVRNLETNNGQGITANYYVETLDKLHSEGKNINLDILHNQGIKEIDFFARYLQKKIELGSQPKELGEHIRRFVRDFNSLIESHTGTNPGITKLDELKPYLQTLNK